MKANSRATAIGRPGSGNGDRGESPPVENPPPRVAEVESDGFDADRFDRFNQKAWKYQQRLLRLRRTIEEKEYRIMDLGTRIARLKKECRALRTEAEAIAGRRDKAMAAGETAGTEERAGRTEYAFGMEGGAA